MERRTSLFRSWWPHIATVTFAAGVLLSRDACLGGARPPPPKPDPETVATAAPATAAPATAEPAPTAAPTGTFATPP